MGKPPTQFDVFMKMHDKAEAKKRYFAGDHENLEYFSQTAKEAQVTYLLSFMYIDCLSIFVHDNDTVLVTCRRRIYRGWSKNTKKTLQTIKMMWGYGRKPNLGEKERRRVISMA